METLPNALSSPLPGNLDVFVPMSSLKGAVHQGRAETEFSAAAAAKTCGAGTSDGMHVDCIHTGRMLFGTGLHHAMDIEYVGIAREVGPVFGAPAPASARRTTHRVALYRAVVHAVQHSSPTDLLHLHCTSHYCKIPALQETCVMGVVVARVAGGVVVATYLPLVLEAAGARPMLHPDMVYVNKRLPMHATLSLALTWDGDSTVLVGAVEVVCCTDPGKPLLSFTSRSTGGVVHNTIYATQHDDTTPTGDAFRHCTTSRELCANSLAAAVAYDRSQQAIRFPLSLMQNSGHAVPFARISLHRGYTRFSGRNVSVCVEHEDRQQMCAELVALCEDAGVLVIPFRVDLRCFPTHARQGVRRCSETEVGYLCDVYCPESTQSRVCHAWEVDDPSARLAFDRTELELAAGGRVDRICAIRHRADFSHLELKDSLVLTAGRCHDIDVGRKAFLIVYDVLLVAGESAAVWDSVAGAWVTRSKHFPEESWFVARRARCLPRYFMQVCEFNQLESLIRDHPFEGTPLPTVCAPPNQVADLRGTAQSLADVLTFVPRNNILLSADPVTHIPLRSVLTQDLCIPGFVVATLCAQLTVTHEWRDVYHAYRLSAPGYVEKELWGSFPYVYPRGRSASGFPGRGVPCRAWLVPPRRDGKYAFTACRWAALCRPFGKIPDKEATVHVLVRYRVVWQDAVQYERSVDVADREIVEFGTGMYYVATEAQFLPVAAVVCRVY